MTRTALVIIRLTMLGGLLALLEPVAAVAHDLRISDVLVVFRSAGTYQIDMALDLEDLVCKRMGVTDAAEAAIRLNGYSADELKDLVGKVRDSLALDVIVRFDGAQDFPAVSFPDFPMPPAHGAVDDKPALLGRTVRLNGQTPAGAKEFTFKVLHVLNVVQLTILDQATGSGVKHLLGIARESPPYRLGAPVSQAGRVEVASRYLVLGYEHILPKGLDHILFVLGLFLLSARLRPLLWQVTAFTIAHSVTLGLSMCDVISLPARIVEPLIAVSITYVAVENMLTSELKPWRPAVVFGFGLLHGLGFAGVLSELGMPKGEFAPALIAFNAGVELGQLSVVLLAFLAVGWFRNQTWYRSSIVVPLSALIALTGFYWSVQRAFYGS